MEAHGLHELSLTTAAAYDAAEPAAGMRAPVPSQYASVPLAQAEMPLLR